MRNNYNESAEDYLETILMLSRTLPVVRSIDIANELNFTKPSVSVAMKNLREKDLIKVSEQGFIELTDEGTKLAESVFERHETLTSILIKAGVPKEIAKADACKIEHVISPETFEAIKKLHI